MSLTPISVMSRPTGNAASIVLVWRSTGAIGLRESGSVETAKLVFEVQDSSGMRIDLDQEVDVHIQLGSAPGGGEYLSPPCVRTSNNGQASVNLFAADPMPEHSVYSLSFATMTAQMADENHEKVEPPLWCSFEATL
ncbi:MAG: hypothetical protein P8Y60_14670 [Calditrichota bacterium]